MKAITVSQPYASLISEGAKFCENRVWETNYRGEIAIHAGLGKQYLSKAELSKYPTGCVIAIAKLTACVGVFSIEQYGDPNEFPDSLIPGTNISWRKAATHLYTEGPWCWILEDVRRIEPIPAKGLQRIWNWFPVQRIKIHD